jgi:hypothetical protein
VKVVSNCDSPGKLVVQDHGKYLNQKTKGRIDFNMLKGSPQEIAARRDIVISKPKKFRSSRASRT